METQLEELSLDVYSHARAAGLSGLKAKIDQSLKEAVQYGRVDAILICEDEGCNQCIHEIRKKG